jgi:hypothetical protein
VRLRDELAWFASQQAHASALPTPHALQA